MDTDCVFCEVWTVCMSFWLFSDFEGKYIHFLKFQINSKYSEELAQESLEWVKAITQEDISISGDMDNFYEVLKDGTLLCRLV
jgi:hypothetical protein